jgi:flagellar capping protein FliD
MLEGINLNNLSVDESGRVSFSGLSSGIDLQGTVDAIIAARRIPVDRLEATVEQNEEKIAALKDVRTILESLRTSLSRLFGQVTFGNNSDIFSAKQAFASSSRVDGTTASAAGNLLGVTVDNAAAASNHTIEILQTAKAHKVSSDQVTNPSAAAGFGASDQFTITSDRSRTSFQSSVAPLATTPLGSTGTLEFIDDNGTIIGTVSYLATDTITDLANAISVNITDVTATVDNVANGVRLNMSGSEAFRMTETTVSGSVLTDLELGVTKINVNAATTLNDLRDLINQANVGATATGINASVVTVTASESYLVLTANDTGVTMSLADTSGTPLDTLGILVGSSVTGNLLGFSEEYEQPYWTAQAASISANSILAPDGRSTADGVIADATATTHPVFTASAETITSGNSYIFSTYARAGDKNNLMLQVNGTGFGGAESAEFNLSTGTLVGGSPTAGVLATNVEDVGNGWYRVSMKVAATTNGTAIFEHYPVDVTASFAGDGTTVNTYLWGSQVEAVAAETVPGPYVSTSIKIKNELQSAQKAQLYADGVLDQSNLIYESDFQTSAAVLMESAGTLSFSGASGALGTVAYTSATTLTQLATDITTNITGVTAAVVTDGTGVRLEISSATAFTISETGGGSAISDLGIDNKRKVIERASNTIDDLFNGVTLSLFAAERGTTITLDIEQDLSQVKTEIFSFVESYNAMRQFVNANKLVDSATGDLDENAGVLAKSLALSEVASSLSQVIGAGVAGVDANFSVLSQIGVDFVDITQEDPLLAENLEIDESLLDSVLLSNADDVRQLFSFDLTSGDPRVTLLGFNGRTTYNSAGYTLNLQPSTGDNQFLHSEENDNAYWTQQAGVVAINDPAVTAPDGTTSADGIVADATATTHPLYTNETVTAGQSYIFSTYARAGDRNNLLLQVNGAGFGGAESAEFNLATGTLVGAPTGGVSSTSVEDAGNGWYRVSMKVTASATGAAAFERYPVDVTPTFAGDGTTVNTHLWGAQLEPVTTETTPSSYVRTGATGAVGQAATANIGGTNDGADDGSATVANNVITVNTGGAEGLQLFFNGLDYISSIQLDMTIGVGAQMFFQIGDLLDVTTGIIDGEIDELTDQNTLNNERITEMLDRLEIQRQNLLERYISMETAIASANRIMESIRQTTEQLAGGSGN